MESTSTTDKPRSKPTNCSKILNICALTIDVNVKSHHIYRNNNILAETFSFFPILTDCQIVQSSTISGKNKRDFLIIVRQTWHLFAHNF